VGTQHPPPPPPPHWRSANFFVNFQVRMGDYVVRPERAYKCA